LNNEVLTVNARIYKLINCLGLTLTLDVSIRVQVAAIARVYVNERNRWNLFNNVFVEPQNYK